MAGDNTTLGVRNVFAPSEIVIVLPNKDIHDDLREPLLESPTNNMNGRHRHASRYGVIGAIFLMPYMCPGQCERFV